MKQDFETASESDWEIASTREAILAPLLWKNESTESAVQRAASALKLSRAMVFRLLRRYRANPKTSTLLPARRGRKVGKKGANCSMRNKSSSLRAKLKTSIRLENALHWPHCTNGLRWPVHGEVRGFLTC